MKKLTLIFKQNPEIEFDFEVEDNETLDFVATNKSFFNTNDSEVTVIDKNNLLLVIVKDIDE